MQVLPRVTRLPCAAAIVPTGLQPFGHTDVWCGGSAYLHEFKAQQVHDIVNHSEAKILFVGDMVWPELDAQAMPHLEGIINIPDYSVLLSRTELLTDARERLNELFGRKYPKYFRKEHISYTHAADPDALALINYTSGTTSNSKGVMLPFRALWSNYQFAIEVLGKQVHRGDSVISMLPLAHMYGMAFEFISNLYTVATYTTSRAYLHPKLC